MPDDDACDAGVVNLDSHLVSLGRSDFNVLDAQVLSGLPSHGGLASDGLEGKWVVSVQFSQ